VRFRSVTTWAVLAIIAVVALAVAAPILLPAFRVGAAPSATAAATDELLLDFVPMTQPTALVVVLRRDATSRAVRYAPSRLSVLGVHDGQAPARETAAIFAKVHAPSFRRFSGKHFTGAGLSTGDQFHLLTLSPSTGAIEETLGFVPDAPEPVRGVVADLLALPARLPSAPMAPAYIRSTDVPPSRLSELRAAPQSRLVPLGAFPPDLQAVLAQAVARPRQFFEVSRGQYDLLLSRRSHGNEVILTHGSRAHQLALFLVEGH
jgi:hypothetical protein